MKQLIEKYPFVIDGGLSNVLEAQGCYLNHKLWTASLLDKNPEAIIQTHYAYLLSFYSHISFKLHS